MALSMDNKRILKTALEKMAAGNAERDKLEGMYIQEHNALTSMLELSPYFRKERLSTIIEARRQLRRNEHEKLDAAEQKLGEAQTLLEDKNKSISDLIKLRTEWLNASPLSDLHSASLKERQNMGNARQAAQKIDKEVAAKLPEFDENMFYNYLKSRGFGTDYYTPKPVLGKLDALLAKLCAFEENSRNEERLQNIKNQSSLRLKKAENTYKNTVDSFGIEVMKMEKEIGLSECLNSTEELIADSDKLMEQLKAQIKTVSEISENTVNMYTRAHVELGNVLSLGGEQMDREAVSALRERVANIVRIEKETASMLIQINNTYTERIRSNKKITEQQGEAVKMGSQGASSILPALGKKSSQTLPK